MVTDNERWMENREKGDAESERKEGVGGKRRDDGCQHAPGCKLFKFAHGLPFFMNLISIKLWSLSLSVYIYLSIYLYIYIYIFIYIYIKILAYQDVSSTYTCTYNKKK